MATLSSMAVQFKTLIDVLRRQADTRPDQPAYTVLEQGETESGWLTFSRLDLQARAIGARLQQMGASAKPVLLCYDSSLDYIAGFFGSLYAGAIAVPAYPPDPVRPDRSLPRLRTIVTDSQAAVVLTTEALQSTVETIIADSGILAGMACLTTDTIADAAAVDWMPPAIDQQSLAFLMYTSGSTRNPKGVMVSHANVLHNLRAFPGFVHRPCGTIVSWLPLFHDLGLLFGVLHPVYHGVPAVLLPSSAFVQKPVRWLQAISRYQATTSGGPNFAYDLCVRKITPEQRATLDLRSWTMALNGAEPVRKETLERFVGTFGACGFREEAWYASYGMSEGTATVTGGLLLQPPIIHTVDKHALEQHRVVEVGADAPTGQPIVGCGGMLLDGQQIAIVDPETRTRCAPDQIGEIWVGGLSVAEGYWQQPDETERTFRAFLADSGAGPFLRTGDLGFLRDGELFVTGRLKDLIIIHGRNLYPQDLERTAEQSHPALRLGGSAAFSIEIAGQERVVLVAEVQPTSSLPLDEVIGAMRQRFVEQHDVAVAAIVLIPANSLPKTSSGKTRRRFCRDLFLDGQLTSVGGWQDPRLDIARRVTRDAPSANSASRSDAVSVAAIEHWLIAAVAERQHLDADQIDIHQPLARYGLASIEMAGLISDLGAWLERSLSMTLPWEQPTIAALARHLANQEPVAPSQASAQPINEPIAIVGIGCRIPGAPNVAAFWQVLRDGVETTTEMPADRWDIERLYHPDPRVPGTMSSARGGFLEHLDRFDAQFFGISPREAAHLDPRQRLMLEITWEALEDAGIPSERLAGSRTGVFVATLTSDYQQLLFDNLTRVDAYSGMGSAASIVANRLSYVLDLRGPSVTVDTACSGSLVALHLACQSIRSGESTAAIVGGVSINLLPDQQVFFTKAGLLAPDGRCKAFSADADGIVRSEGAAVLILKRLSQALGDGDPVYAIIRGSAVNSDGRSNGLSAPNGLAQEAVIRDAYRSAGIAPAQVQYVEAHGTGTRLGDPIEIQALATVLAEGREAERCCAIGSVKTNVGHLEAAAGIAGVIKVALALKHRLLPGTLHVQTLNPLIPFDRLPLFVQRETGPWPMATEPLIAGVSSFGIGGTNAHVVLEEPPQQPAPERDLPPTDPYLLPISARDPQALRALAQSYQQLAASPQDDMALADLCFTASLRRSHHEYRLALLARSLPELAEQLGAFLRDESRPGLAAGRARTGQRRKLAFVFSGQGSHWARMGYGLMDQEPVFRSTLEACDRILRQLVDWSLLDELRAGPQESRLTTPEIIQPAITAIQIALAALWRSWGIIPDVVVGQSLGEIAAAHVAGALTLEDALRVVVNRGQLMRRVAGRGKTMFAQISAEQARRIVDDYPGRIDLAGISSPTTCVLSGDSAALGAVHALLSEQGIFCRMVPEVDSALHSSQLDPIKAELVQRLTALQPRAVTIPVYSTVTGELIAGEQMDAAYWGRNLRDPFLFGPVMQRLLAERCDLFVEISPHPVLIHSILEVLHHADQTGSVVGSLRRNVDERHTLLAALGTLYTAGAAVEWGALLPATARHVALPTYPWQRERYWFDQIEVASEAHANDRPRGIPKAGHPLLGLPLPLALPTTQQVWNQQISVASLPYVQDHLVGGQMVLPGAAYVELALAAVAPASDESIALTDVVFSQAMVLSAEHARHVQLVLTTGTRRDQRFQVFSRLVQQDQPDSPWTLHASGNIGRVAHEHASALSETDLTPAEIQARCTTRISAEEHYRSMADRGLDYGPSFRAVVEIWRHVGDALGRLELPDLVEAEQYAIHPVVLDAGFQVVAATLPPIDDAAAQYLPSGIERLVWYGRPPRRSWCYARLRPLEDGYSDSYVADLRLSDDTGRVYAAVTGLRLQRIGAPQVSQADSHAGLYELQWCPAPLRQAPLQPRDSESGRWIIFADRQGFAQSLAARLEAEGNLCVLIVAGAYAEQQTQRQVVSIEPHSADAYRQVFADLARSGADWRGIIDLRGMDLALSEESPPSTALTDALRDYECVLHLLQALSRTSWVRRPRLWLVTRGAQATDDDQTYSGLAAAPLWGLGRVIAQEYPELWGSLVDLDPDTDCGELLAAELRRPDQEPAVLFRNRQRFVTRLASARRDEYRQPRPFRADGSYLITGGLGGLGLQVARWIVAQGGRRLILMSRTPLPSRSTWKDLPAAHPMHEQVQTIMELEAAGASIHLAAVDVADEAQLANFLTIYRQEGWPPIRGVIHVAGVLHDQLLSEMDSAAFNAVIRPKITGAWLLHRLLADAQLDLFVLFSSVASLLGPLGQGNYAAGNAFLDALAHYRRARGLPATSINWGPWATVGMAARRNLSDDHRRQGIAAITPDQGLDLLGQVLADNPTQIAVLAADWHRLHEQMNQTPLLAELLREQERQPMPDIAVTRAKFHEQLLLTPIEERPALIQEHLHPLAALILRLDPALLDPQTPLLAFGLDSIMAVELRNYVETLLGLSMSVLDLLQGASLSRLASELVAQTPDDHDLDELLAEIEQFFEEAD